MVADFGDVEVYQVDHHGSKYSTNQYLVDTIKPNVAIFSVGNNAYGHPAQEVIDRLANASCYMYFTEEGAGGTPKGGDGELVHGDIKITTEGNSYTINGEKTYSSEEYHVPIYIDGNTNFTAENGVSSGLGTQTDPYIIENWDIKASKANGIEIENTDAYFVIRNCVIHEGKDDYNYGIYFSNVSNGIIDNVISYQNDWGIYLNHCSNAKIKNCKVYNNEENGIDLDYFSKNNKITNCTVYNNEDDGIGLYYSSNNEIHYSNIYNNTGYGVYSIFSDVVNATNNWWGSRNGPGGVGPGDGDEVSEYVLYEPWLTKPTEGITFDPSKIKIPLDSTKATNVTLDSAPNGLSGYNITISLSNVSVAEITSVDFPSWASMNSNSSLPSDSVWIKAVDLNNEVESGAKNVTLASLAVRGDRLGSCNISITVTRMDDDSGNTIEAITIPGQVEVVSVIPFPGCDNPPTDPDNDWLYEDINGNGREDFDDVVCFFENLEWVKENQPQLECFDFNKNGRIDFNDVVKLFEEI